MSLQSPFWTVSVGEENPVLLEGIGEKQDLKFVSNSDSDDELTLEYCNCPPDVTSRSELIPGTKLLIVFGRLGNESEPLLAVISSPEKIYDDNILKIKCRDIGFTQKGMRNSKVYPESNSLGDVAESIAEKWGLDSNISNEMYEIPGSEFDRHQTNESDWVYLRRLADSKGVRFWIDNKKIVFRKDLDTKSQVRFVFGSGNIVKKLRIWTEAQDSRSADAGVTAKGFDADTRSPVESTANSDTDNDQKLSGGYLKVDLNTARIIEDNEGTIINVASGDPKEIAAAAAAARELAVRKQQRGSMSITGFPFLRKNMFITLDGVDQMHAGLWRIKKASHVCGKSGYECQLDIDRETTGKVDSAQIGIVKTQNVKNDEAEKEEEDLTVDLNSGTIR